MMTQNRPIPSALPSHLTILLLVALVVFAAGPAAAQLDDSCVVNVLNRSAQVKPDGTWSIPDAPANTGLVRARATCVDGGITRSGQSDFFLIPADGAVEVPEIVFGEVSPVPETLRVTASPALLSDEGAVSELTVTAIFPDGTTRDVTTASRGTSYTISNPAVATVGSDGVVTAASSGSVLVTATNDGAIGMATVQVVLSGDTDGDGIPDAVEIEAGLDPASAVDALEDLDGDGLTNGRELIELGTDIRDGDSDGDGLGDGAEVRGETGFLTDPTAFDTDGDGFGDGLEIDTGTDPTDPASFDLAAALTDLRVEPGELVITVNSLLGEASRQLRVTGELIDGTTLDLTSTGRQTVYSSSDLSVCSFGVEDGVVFGGQAGSCTVTATNNGLDATASVTVETFRPTALAAVDIPGFANNVDVVEGFAYVAAGSAGLQVVSIEDPAAPGIVGEVDSPGTASDVRVVGDLAYLADGEAGLRIYDIADRDAPFFLGSLDTSGFAQDLVVRAGLAYVADGSAGLLVVDVSDPAVPTLVASAASAAPASGVDVTADGELGVVAAGGSGIRTVDLSSVLDPRVVGSLDTGNARDVALASGFAFVADRSSSLVAVDLADPARPLVRGITPRSTGGLLTDVALASGFAFGADIFFVNGVPITDIRVPADPVPREILDFSAFTDDNGTGIAVDSSFVYLTAAQRAIENGSTGSSRLYVGRYLRIDDTAGIPPSVFVRQPDPGTEVIERDDLEVVVEAEDDFGVAAVELLVDGEVARRDVLEPFTFSLRVPAGVGQLTLGARAIDRAGNVAEASPIVLDVVPDPLTTVTGVVVDPERSAIEGAQVTTAGLDTVTDAAGLFAIPGVPTVSGDLVVRASAEVDGVRLAGSSAPTPPVPGGTTDVGELVVGLSGDLPPDRLAVIDRIGGFESPGTLVPTPDGRRLFVAETLRSRSPVEGRLSVVDPATRTIVERIPLGFGHPLDAVLSTDGRRIFVAISDTAGSTNTPGPNRVAVVDTEALTVEATILTPGFSGFGPTSIDVAPDGSEAYLVDRGSDLFEVIDLARLEVVATRRVGGTPTDVAVTPDGSRAYVASRSSRTFTGIDLAERRVIASIGLSQPRSNGNTYIDFTPDGSRALVTYTTSDRVSVVDIDPASPTFHEEIAVVPTTGSRLRELVVDDVGDTAAVANQSNELVLLDVDPASPTLHEQIGAVSLGQASNRIALGRNGTDLVYVTVGTGEVLVLGIGDAALTEPAPF